MKTPRGLRNNNPLNIRHSASRWQGARVEQTDKAFVQFTSMKMGYRAAWRILETYFKHFEAQHKPFTPRNIIYRWAPPNENDSEAYLRRVCRLTNLAGNEALVRPSLLRVQSTEYRVQSTTAWRGGGGEVKVLELLKVLKGFTASKVRKVSTFSKLLNVIRKFNTAPQRCLHRSRPSSENETY